MTEGAAIKIYTDGSCHTQLRIGAWAAILLIENDKVTIEGCQINTTHNRMEMLAVIEAIHYLERQGMSERHLEVYSDSQYVVNLCTRKEKLKQKSFYTNKGSSIQNEDLVKTLINLMESHSINFIKIKAHQKNGDAFNREVDMVVRTAVRKKTREYESAHN